MPWLRRLRPDPLGEDERAVLEYVPSHFKVAHILVAKYGVHLPLHRQAVIYGQVELERSTLADWVGQAAFLLEPLATAIARYVRAGATLHADDMPVPVLDPGRGRTKTGRLWVRHPAACDDAFIVPLFFKCLKTL